MSRTARRRLEPLPAYYAWQDAASRPLDASDFRVLLAVNVPPGDYVVTGKAFAGRTQIGEDDPNWVQCVVMQDGTTLDLSATGLPDTVSSGATIVTHTPSHAEAPSTLALACRGASTRALSPPVVAYLRLTAVRVAALVAEQPE